MSPSVPGGALYQTILNPQVALMLRNPGSVHFPVSHEETVKKGNTLSPEALNRTGAVLWSVSKSGLQ